MTNESEIFLPASIDTRPQRRYHRTPCLSSCLFNLFEQSTLYATLVFLAFVFPVYVSTLTTYTEHYEESVPVLLYTELALFSYCLIEFFLRIYASQSRVRYQGFKGKRRFFYERYLFIDLMLLIAYVVVFALNFNHFNDPPIHFLHGLRFLQLFRFLPLDRHVKSIPLIGLITWQYRRVLSAAVYSCFLLLLPTAYLLWIVERSIETDGKFFFKTYTDSLWFTINSMATIGYGDTWPQTLIGDINQNFDILTLCFFLLKGRTITAVLCCLGVVLWTLPAGIISAGLTSIDEQRRESEHLRRPAARLILAWWRVKTAHDQSQAVSGQQQEKATCNEFIARLLFNRHLREFQRYRYGTSDEYDTQIRRDIDRILRALQRMDEKLNAIDQNFVH